MTRRPYAPHEQLVAPARPRAEVWRLFAGIALIAAVVFGSNAVLLALLAGLGPANWLSDVMAGSTPAAMLLLLGSFGFVVLGVALAVRQLQKRSLISVIGPRRQTVAQFLRVLRLLFLLFVLLLALPPYGMDAPLERNLPVATWLALLPFAVIAILIQTGAEEILFRGYLQQALAARFRSPVLWMGLPSALFAMGHYLPVEAGDNALLIAIWSGVFGLLMADLTARAGTLGPAIALHLFNNVIALLFVALPDSLDGLSLYLLPYQMSDTEQLRAWLAVDFALMVVGWLVARIAIRR